MTDLETGAPPQQPQGPKKITLVHPTEAELVSYFCPECGGVEKVTKATATLFHKHRYGPDTLQIGLIRMLPLMDLMKGEVR